MPYGFKTRPSHSLPWRASSTASGSSATLVKTQNPGKDKHTRPLKPCRYVYNDKSAQSLDKPKWFETFAACKQANHKKCGMPTDPKPFRLKDTKKSKPAFSKQSPASVCLPRSFRSKLPSTWTNSDKRVKSVKKQR